MPDLTNEVDFELDLTFNPGAPEELQELGRRYWQVEGINGYTNSIEWVYKTADLDYQAWSGTAHYAAAAAVVASSPSFACRTCGGVLTLSSRQTLTDARGGYAKDCRACSRTIEERAAAVLDPASLAKREQRAEKKRIDDERRAQQHAADQARRDVEADLETKRRAAIAERYPSETPDDGGYDLSKASLAAKVGALATIHAAGKPGGLIHPVRLNDQTLAPNYPTSEDLFLAAWYADLVLVHPSSATNALVWKHGDEATLGDGIYVDRARFAAPGEGQLGPRLDVHTEHLRDALGLEHLWSTDRRELELLSQRLVSGEAIRYFRHLLADHGLPDPSDEHEARLRSHTEKAAALFSLGHIYRMAWTAVRDAVSAYERIAGMSRENATTHGVNKLISYIQQRIDDPSTLGSAFSESAQLALSAATDVVFRIVLRLNPMTATPVEVRDLLRDPPDEELRRLCDRAIPYHGEMIEWLRTDRAWSPEGFHAALARIADEEFDLCAPDCAHERAPLVAAQADAIYRRIVSRIGEIDAVICTAEAMAMGNVAPNLSRAGDLALAEVLRGLGWVGATGSGEAELVDDVLGSPNCPRCLVPLRLVGSVDSPRWQCPGCGLAKIV